MLVKGAYLMVIKVLFTQITYSDRDNRCFDLFDSKPTIMIERENTG
jgi:hypothetical protein